jgi:hypothetical protein
LLALISAHVQKCRVCTNPNSFIFLSLRIQMQRLVLCLLVALAVASECRWPAFKDRVIGFDSWADRNGRMISPGLWHRVEFEYDGTSDDHTQLFRYDPCHAHVCALGMTCRPCESGTTQVHYPMFESGSVHSNQVHATWVHTYAECVWP